MRKLHMLALLLMLISFPAWSADAAAVTSTTLLTSSNSWDNTPLPAYPAGQPKITIARVQIAPGANIPAHLHHNTIAAGVLLQGQLKVVTDSGATIELVAGDAVIETIDTWHSGQNTGRVPTELIVFYAGIEGQAVSESKP
ncbi:MAG: cupin domain-containing protein [Pseudomonadota bacterium]